MVFVKVRETYDLHTVQNKMTVIAIHTPRPAIIQRNFPGLLVQCKAYRPVSCDVRVACASVLPLDPNGVGLEEGSVAPEDVFNPILYKACSNFGMSQIEARIFQLAHGDVDVDIAGTTASVEVDNTTNMDDEFPLYYGFLANAHGWRSANPQAGLEMTNLKPLVYEMLYNTGDMTPSGTQPGTTDRVSYPLADGSRGTSTIVSAVRGNAKPLPFINCTSYSAGAAPPGWTYDQVPYIPYNHEIAVPWVNCVVGAILVPPSKLHELFYRMVVEWTIEFSQIRPVSEITDWAGVSSFGDATHYQNYSYANTKKALTGSEDTILTQDTAMVSTTAPIEKVF